MLAPGTVLQGRYRIVRQLGKGGMGTVYEAIDERLRNKVALKETSCSEDFLRQAFEREAVIMARLRHPALPVVIDHFSEPLGQFLVMQFIPGKDLHELLIERGSVFPLEEVLGWADKLLEVLDYLHNQPSPIIHRDIKPANLKLTETGEILLLDFGLAKSVNTNVQSIHAFTEAYAPIEQIKGEKTDARCDLFSLAATVYHLLTGQLPVSAKVRDTLAQHNMPDLLRPAHEANSQVTPAVGSVLQQALALNREQRPASARELRQMLRQAHGKPAAIYNPPPVPGPKFDPDAETILATAQAKIVNSLGMEFVLMPAGSFQMGSENGGTDEKPVHTVTFQRPFYLGKFQVTQVQWQAMMGNNPSYFKGDNLPVEQVSWNDCQEFLKKLNAKKDGYTYRLPSEAEWEYACRAGTTGDYARELDVIGWYGNNSGRKKLDADEIWKTDQANYGQRLLDNGCQTHPVGQKTPNAWGLYDMHGNVWEWCQDWYQDSYKGAPTDGSAWELGSDKQYRVLRGGSWDVGAGGCRSAFRFWCFPGNLVRIVGFRVVAARAVNT